MPTQQFTAMSRESGLMRRPVTLDERARVVAFLGSDHASCMTGQVVNASCGLVLH
jgi:enoyl-[acyl-carrier-protein] reductase (NADH)